MIGDKFVNRGWSIFVVTAFCACAVSCRQPSSPVDSGNGGVVRVISGAYPASETRVEYEADEVSGRRRVVWSEGDELQVAAFTGEGRVNASGALWRRFGMVADHGFDKEYMCFQGDALLPEGSVEATLQQLYAFYPAYMLGDTGVDEIMFPSVQKYKPGSFDTDAVVMVSAPVEVEIPSQGSVETPPFRMRHYTGYLQLFPKGFPEAVASEKLVKVVMQAASDTALSGTFTLNIDQHTQEWTILPGPDTSDVIELDCQSSGVTVGGMSEWWFAMLPGRYAELTFTLYTDTGSVIVMKRSGLEIKSGVIKTQDINFRTGDILRKAVVIELDGSDLGLEEFVSSDTMEGSKDGINFRCSKVRYVASGSDKYIELSRKGSHISNITPLPSPIVRVEVDYPDAFSAKFTHVKLGSTLDYEVSETASESGLNCVYAPDGSDYRYFCIEDTASSEVEIKSIRIICAPGA